MSKYNDLAEMSAAVETIKADCLFDSECVEALPPVAEQHFAVGIALLSQAMAAFKLADYARMRGE